MSELNNIGNDTRTDKASWAHDYLHVYESYLHPYRNAPISLIELGVGGYHYPDRGGESLRMWYKYFSHAKIIGIDIHGKENIINNRTEFWQGSQTDANLLQTILQREEKAPQRIIIDDASHNNKLTIESFNIIFPLLKSGDLYFVEDVHTSYWNTEEYEGKDRPGAGNTTMEYFARLTHQLNAEHFAAQYRNEYAGKIAFIHFYKELIVIKKL